VLKRIKLEIGGLFFRVLGFQVFNGFKTVGKLLKLRSDMLFLLLAREPERRFIILTEQDMYDVCLKEKKGGRVPENIEFKLAEIPEELRKKLNLARENASKEESPR
jgi:hypothetical protein